jgi:hypothetical protein
MCLHGLVQAGAALHLGHHIQRNGTHTRVRRGGVQQFQGTQQRDARLHQGGQLAGEARYLFGAGWPGGLGATHALDANGSNALRMQMRFDVSALQG